MPSSARWRLKFTASHNSPYVTMAELEMASAVGGTDLCTGGTPSASSEFAGGGFEASKAFDNNASTRWNNNGDLASSCWLEYQFASAVTIVEYRIQTASSPTSSPSAWTFEYWDGSAWQVADTVSNQPGWQSGETRTYNLVPVATLTPIAYWPFDEATGTTAADASGNGHTATLVNGTWDTSSNKKFGAAALGNTDTSRAASFTPFSLGTIHTLAFWINGWNGTNDGLLVGGASGIYGGYLDSSNISYGITGGSFVLAAHSGLTGAHHVVITRNGSAVRFFKDGAPLTVAGALSSNPAQTFGSLGGYDGGTLGFAATLDDVRFYGVALSAAQVAELYALTPAPAAVEADITSEAPVAESAISAIVVEPIEATITSEAPVPESIIRTTLQSLSVYAEVDLNDRRSYYGGYKAPLVLNFMGARRGVSDREGQLEHLQFGATLSDTSGRFRGLLASAENKYLLNRPITQRVITDAARRLEEEAWIVANGFVSDYAPLPNRQFKIIGQDWLKKKFATNVSAGAWQPRVRAEDFPNANNVYQQNVGRIIPIIYGRITDTRLYGSLPTEDYGDGQLVPIYGGDTVLLGETWAIGIIAAHHCAYLEAAFWLPGGLNGVDLDADPDWLTPRSTNWAAAGFTRPFQTINGRDYFVIYVKGDPGENLRQGEPVNNDQAITVNVWGRTNTGDETGTLLTNGFDIYEDFLLNYLCPDTPWVSGPPLPMPTFGPHVGSAPYVDLASIDACKVVAEARLDGGYQLDFALGAMNETWSLANAIAEFNKCLDCEGYINHYGAYALTMEPDSIDAAAIIEVDEPLTDVHDIVVGGLTIADQTKDFWNVVPFRHTFDYCNRNQRHAWNSPWRSLHSGIHEIRHDPSVARYEQERVAPAYEFFFIRGKNRDTDSEYYWQGTLMALDIVSRVVARYANPRRRVQITTAFNGLQYDIGDIVPVSAQDGIGVNGWTDRRIRVTGHEVLATTGQVVLDGYDFDAVLEAADDWARART